MIDIELLTWHGLAVITGGSVLAGNCSRIYQLRVTKGGSHL